MKKYRKLPVVIEAAEITVKTELEIRNWSGGKVYPSPVLAPIIQAYAEGKVIECRAGDPDMWSVEHEPMFKDGFEYRIKSEQKKRLMTSGEVLYMVTTTPAMVYRHQCGTPFPAQVFDYRKVDYDCEWAIIDKSGEPIDGWHKFETEDATA